MKRLIPLLLGIALLAASPPPPLAGYSSSVTGDLFGYYMPTRDVVSGRFKLITLAIGPTEDFKNFQAGERWNGKWAPILLEFAPTASKQQPRPEGGSFWPGSFRVLPMAYRVTNTSIAFSGRDAKLGTVTFSGAIDSAALKREKNQGSGKTVLKGDLTVGGKSFTGLTFTWFGGD